MSTSEDVSDPEIESLTEQHSLHSLSVSAASSSDSPKLK